MAGTFWNSSIQAYQISSDYAIHLTKNELRAIFCATWLGAMICVGISYFILSTKQQRKSKLFTIQIICIILAIFHNASEIGIQIYHINSLFLRSDKRIKWVFFSLWLALGNTLDHIIPLLADSALLFRLSAFFPFPVYSKKYRLLVLVPFYIIIFIRSLLCIIVLVFYACINLIGIDWDSRSPIPIVYQPYWTYATAEYSSTLENSLASLYCIVASTVLLRRAYKLSKSQISTSNNRIKMKMKFLTEALIMCFIPPFFLNIAAQIQLLGGWNKYVYYRETQTLNVNLSVIFSILATSWSSIRESMSRETQTEIQAVTTMVK